MTTTAHIQTLLPAVAMLALLVGLGGCGGGASTTPTPGTDVNQAPPLAHTQGITLSAAAASPTKATMSWTGSSAPGDKFQVYRNGELDSSATGDSTSAADTGLAPGTQYCYQVSVANSTGAGMASSNQSCLTTAPLAGWDIRIIKQAPPLSLALDAQSLERIGFCTAGGVIYQARQTDDTWNTAQVDAGAACFSTSLAVGGDGSSHMIYLDGNSNALKYATDVSGRWSVSPIPGTEGAQFYSMALDSGNHVHIAYVFFTGMAPNCYQIVYTSNASGDWQSTVVAELQAYPVIAVDGSGAPHIAYVDGEASSGPYPVHYLTATSSGWTDSVVATSADAKSLAALAVDSAGHAHLVYKSEADLDYVSDVSGTWKTEQVESFDAAGPQNDRYGAYDVSIDLDTSGLPHLSYEDTDGNLKYAVQSQGKWSTRYVDTEGRENEIRVDQAGHAHIAYANTENLYSKLAVSP